MSSSASVSNLLCSSLNQHVLAILEKCRHLNHLKQLQSFLVSLGHSQTQFFAFKLVRFCALRLSDLRYARFVFDHLLSPNIFLYTAMITAYASHPDQLSAIDLFRRMLRRGLPRPNHFIYPHVLKSSTEVSLPLATKSVHTQVMKSGFGEYPVVQTALVDAYSKSASDFGIARKLFDEMSERTVVSWTAMVSGYTRVGDIDNAILLFDEMPERDVPSWNAIIAGCTQNGMFPEAISLFRRMMTLTEERHHRQNKPNQVTTVCVLSACAHTGMLHLGKSVHSYAYRNCLEGDSFVSNALVDMYGKCGNLQTARMIFEMSAKKSLPFWNSMINSFALHGESEEAISVFEKMLHCEDDGIRPDSITFIGLLNACAHGALLDEGRFYFKLLTHYYEIEPRIEHYGCLIDLLGRAGQFEEALEVVRTMKMEPDEVVWGSLLNGCKKFGHTDLAKFAVEKLVEIDPRNVDYGIMLANLHAESGKWDEVRAVRKRFEKQNGSKTPGCSWIEVDEQVHQFYSVDNSHPRTEETHRILEIMFCLH